MHYFTTSVSNSLLFFFLPQFGPFSVFPRFSLCEFYLSVSKVESMLRLNFKGVQINSFLRFRSFLPYSTSTEEPVHFMVDYLVDSLGFSREEAVAASNKVSQNSRIKFPENPNSVINFFKQIGLNQSQIKTMVLYDARLLTVRDINKTLIPRIRAFQDLGFSADELGSVLASNPSIPLRSLTQIKPLIECLRSIFGSDENVVKVIKHCPWLVKFNAKRWLSNVSLLRSYALSAERLGKLFLYNPMHVFRPTEILEEHLRDVETKLGIPRESKMFIHGIHVYSTISIDRMESKFRVFKSYGWTENDIKTMIRKMPSCLNLSEAKVRSGLDLFMKELSYKPDYISHRPSLLLYSLENRILPRMAVWKALREKKLIKANLSIYSVMVITDECFLNNYVMRFKNELPEVCQHYIKERSSSPS